MHTSGRSWWLDDGQALADKYPYTFYKPSPEAILSLSVGDLVKLIFRFESDDPDVPNAERMWVEISDISNERFSGRLDNDPVYIQDIKCGDPVHFEAKHVIQISIEDPVPDPTARYAPCCFVTKKVLYERIPVGYLYRETPDNEKDSGWRILAGDEDEAYMDDSENIFFVSLGAVLREDDSFVELLDAPIGSAYVRNSSSDEFVAVDEGVN